MKSHFWLFTWAILATCAWPMLAWSQAPLGAPPGGYAPFAPPGAYPAAFANQMPGPGMMSQPPGRYAVPAGVYAPDMAVPGMVTPGAMPPGSVAMGSSVLAEPPPMGPMPGGPMMGGPIMGEPMGYGDCPDGNCGMPAGSRIWGEAELVWWRPQGRSVPALVTTSPNGTVQAEAGVLGFPDTEILYGNERVGDSWRTGFRGGIGLWLGNRQEVGIWARGWNVDFEDQTFFANSTGDPILARPFYNLEILAQDSLLVAFPGIVEGNVAVQVGGDATSGELLGRWALERGEGYRLDFLGGYQYARINDTLRIETNLVSTDPGGLVPVGTTIEGFDAFGGRNTFHGGVVGLMSEVQKGRFLFRFLGKCGLGNMRQQVTIDGQTVVTTPAPGPTVTVLDGNLLTQPSNIGSYETNRFCVVPELNLTMTYQMTCNLDFMIGYTFIYYSSLSTAGGAIDTNVNLSDPPSGDPGPLFAFDSRDMWIQGGNIGLLFHW